MPRSSKPSNDQVVDPTPKEVVAPVAPVVENDDAEDNGPEAKHEAAPAAPVAPAAVVKKGRGTVTKLGPHTWRTSY